MRLFWKLFLLQLLAASAVLAGVLMLSRSLTVQGFSSFLEARERERVEQLAEQISRAMEEGEELGGAWDQIAQRRRVERFRPPEREDVETMTDFGGSRFVVRRHVSRPPLQLQDAD